MKLAAMEGLYRGEAGQSLVAVGILNPEKEPGDDREPFLFDISIPKGLSLLAYHDPDAFVAGVDDLIEGRQPDSHGNETEGISYAERMERGRKAQRLLEEYAVAMEKGDEGQMAYLEELFRVDYPYFGYGYFNGPREAVPPVGLTFYAFHVMVTLGGYFLLFYIVVLFLAYKREGFLRSARWLQTIAVVSVPLMWLCSEAGWVVAEVGRQPWTVQDLLPTCAAVSAIPSDSVIVTFWIFAAVFTLLLIAEIGIMLRYIGKYGR